MLDTVSKGNWVQTLCPERLAELSWPGPWCQALADSQALLSEAQMTWLLCEPEDEGSFLGPHGLICPLSFPHQHSCHRTNIVNANTDCVTLLFRTLPPLSPLPSGRVHAARAALPSLFPAPKHVMCSKHQRTPMLPQGSRLSHLRTVPFP